MGIRRVAADLLQDRICRMLVFLVDDNEEVTADALSVLVKDRPLVQPGCTERQIKFGGGCGNDERAFGVTGDIGNVAVDLLTGGETGKFGGLDVDEVLIYHQGGDQLDQPGAAVRMISVHCQVFFAY